ncbi:hypothetical protein ABGB17_02835 [Sphaerisporangium sp. B11E5]|uniref:hypothetical protein n=1 Tax=Sphaerisporangium sp. B11E5 TaxID=3153563 RepID=UPI00325DD4F9
MPPWPLDGALSLRTRIDDVPIDAGISATLRDLGNLEMGRNLEQKFRFVDLEYTPDNSLNISLAPTTWSESRSFHIALERDPLRLSRGRDGAWIEPVPLGGTVLPGIAVVHGIVLTSDAQVLFAQRNPKVGYAPLHWSASFEEQLQSAARHVAAAMRAPVSLVDG